MSLSEISGINPKAKQSVGVVLRCATIFAVLAHIVVFNVAYQSYVATLYGYLGYRSDALSLNTLLILGAFALAPAVVLKPKLSKPSDLVIWMLYLCVYIPSIFVPQYIQLQPAETVAHLRVLLLIAMAIYVLFNSRGPSRPLSLQCPSPLFWIISGGTAAILVLYIIVIYRSNLHFVAFARVYDSIRWSGAEVGAGTYARYAVMLLGGGFLPFIVSVSLARKKMWFFAAGLGANVILYMTCGDRIYLLAPVMMMGAYVIGRRPKLLNRAGVVIALSFATACGVLCAIEQATRFGEHGDSPLQTVAGLLLMRIFTVPGLNTSIYSDFFATHPLTYFSHVNLIGKFIQYPYDRSVGEVVGSYYLNSSEVNANAHLWATDGIAALGPYGIIIITVISLPVFVLLDRVAARYPIRVVLPMAVLPAILLCNVSLFTSIGSGGLGVLILLLFLAPWDNSSSPKNVGSHPNDRSRQSRRTTPRDHRLAEFL
jgi:hypothetical protein